MDNPLTTQDAVETWKVAHRFTLDVYRLSARLPADEQQGLTPKLRNSAVKVASRIVEGYARKDNPSYAGHLTDSQSALEETKYSLLVARDLGYISEESYNSIMTDAEAIGERLDQLQSSLGASDQETTPAETPALPERTPEPTPPPAFGTKKTVKDTWGDLLGWFKGNKDRQVKNERYDNVWTEDSPVTSYLEDGEKTPKF
ncbi:four helix bundle protein [Patescibacteria group bacterium]|nr:four helix bundle protein [Patescibacteria group bacterium]